MIRSLRKLPRLTLMAQVKQCKERSDELKHVYGELTYEPARSEATMRPTQPQFLTPRFARRCRFLGVVSPPPRRLDVTIPVNDEVGEELERMHDPPPAPYSVSHLERITSRPAPPAKTPLKKCGNCELFETCWSMGDGHTIWEYKRLGEKKFLEAAGESLLAKDIDPKMLSKGQRPHWEAVTEEVREC